MKKTLIICSLLAAAVALSATPGGRGGRSNKSGTPSDAVVKKEHPEKIPGAAVRRPEHPEKRKPAPPRGMGKPQPKKPLPPPPPPKKPWWHLW